MLKQGGKFLCSDAFERAQLRIEHFNPETLFFF